MKSVFSRLILIFVAAYCALAGLGDRFGTTLATKYRQAVPTSFYQSKERLLRKSSDYNPPVKIVLAKQNKGPIKFGKKFQAGDDWLKGLAVALANHSGKSVTYVDIEILFVRPENQRLPPAVWHLEYGRSPLRTQFEDVASLLPVKPVLPGDIFEIRLDDSEFEQMQSFLISAQYRDGVDHVQLRANVIGFGDGTAWTGRMIERDPGSPAGWRPKASREPQRMFSEPNPANRRSPSFVQAKFGGRFLLAGATSNIVSPSSVWLGT